MKNMFIFVAGAAIGSAVTYFLMRQKLEQEKREEINAIKARYKEDFGDKNTNNSERSETRTEESETISPEEQALIKKYDTDGARSEMLDIIAEHNYAYGLTHKEAPVDTKEAPYVISPEEFGEFEEYETICLTYYSDDIIADEDDEIVENADEILGVNIRSKFGEYEDDAVHIRNDKMKCDYELLYDVRTYKEGRVGHPR